MNITTDQAELQKVTDRVRKLLSLAAKNPNEAEAASAAAKAQEILLAYNLDMAAVSQGGDSGKREDARQRGGMYRYERQLWEAIAELNFCLYFTYRKWMIRRAAKRDEAGHLIRAEKRFLGFEHRVIGRTVNVTTTRVMGEYLQSTIERLCRERLHGDHGDKAYTQFFTSWAIAFREGIADRVVEKLHERRRDLISKEKRRAAAAAKAAREAARKGVSTATALTITSLQQSEEDANMDFLYGEGYSARNAAEDAQRAAANAAAEKAYAEWAAANPEEAKEEEAKRQAESRKYWARRRGGRQGYSESGAERRRQSGGYYEGYDKGKEVSIEPQVDKGKHKRIGRG